MSHAADYTEGTDWAAVPILNRRRGRRDGARTVTPGLRHDRSVSVYAPDPLRVVSIGLRDVSLTRHEPETLARFSLALVSTGGAGGAEARCWPRIPAQFIQRTSVKDQDTPFE
jgi:hypothetical protein